MQLEKGVYFFGLNVVNCGFQVPGSILIRSVDLHCNYVAVVRPSNLHNKNPHSGKGTSLYRDAQVMVNCSIFQMI